jgi:Holliday junction DNA helicase RuvA
MDAERFARCLEQEDIAMLCRLPGIGKKTAQRLVVEMKDRIAELGGLPAAPGLRPAASPVAAVDDALSDAVSALIALGYRPPDANRMARAVDDGAKTSEEIIRAALKSVTPS